MQTSKKLLTIVAAIALMGTMASEADAFGIVIRFGGFRVHHVGRHHSYASRRHHTETRSARTKSTNREAKTETKKTPNDYASGKDQILAVAKAVTGERKAVDLAWQTYLNLPQSFRNSVGPVGIFTFANIADYRRITQRYNAPDNMGGASAPVDFPDGKGFYCRVNIVVNVVDNDLPSSSCSRTRPLYRLPWQDRALDAANGGVLSGRNEGDEGQVDR